MLLSHRKNGLTSLFKEVRVFKVLVYWAFLALAGVGAERFHSSLESSLPPFETQGKQTLSQQCQNLAYIAKSQVRKNSLNIKFLGGIFLGHPGPRTSGYPGQKLYASGLFLLF